MTARVVTFGCFDLFHIGHLRLLERAAGYGALHVGVLSDDLVADRKGRRPVVPEQERLQIVGGVRHVRHAFLEAVPDKRHYLRLLRADHLVMGDDWAGLFDDLADVCDVVYLPRTPGVSTSGTIASISERSSPRPDPPGAMYCDATNTIASGTNR